MKKIISIALIAVLALALLAGCGSSAAPPGTSTHQTAASPAQASAAMPAARRRRFCSDIFSVPSPFGGCAVPLLRAHSAPPRNA